MRRCLQIAAMEVRQTRDLQPADIYKYRYIYQWLSINIDISTSGYLHTSRRVSPGPGFLLRPWHVALGHQDNSSPPQPQQTFNSTLHSTVGGEVVTSSDHLVIVEVMSCDRVR